MGVQVPLRAQGKTPGIQGFQGFFSVSNHADAEESAKLLLTVLKASGNNIDTAPESVRSYRGVYTVFRMIEDHISLLMVSGYTIRRYRGILPCHIADGLGMLNATKVEYRDIVTWVKGMQAKGLEPKTIANVDGLISASFNIMVKDKQRADNPCKGISLPKGVATEETATFLTPDEWRRVQAELTEPYESFFTFLVHTGLRYPEATALQAKDFEITLTGHHVVNVGTPSTKPSSTPGCGPRPN